MSLDDLYQEVILDHFRNPRCHGCITHAPLQMQLFNPLCGDQVSVSASIAEGKLTEIGFAGQGCSISQSSASMMADLCKGKGLVEVRGLIADFRSLMRGERTAEDLPTLGDAAALQGVRRFSARIKCAMLAWEALERCIEKHETTPTA